MGEYRTPAGTYNPAKLLGVTKLDVVRAQAFVADILQLDPAQVRLPLTLRRCGNNCLPQGGGLGPRRCCSADSFVVVVGVNPLLL